MNKRLKPSDITTKEYIIKSNFEYSVPLGDTTQAGGYYYYYAYGSGNVCYAWHTDRIECLNSLPGYHYYTGWQCGLYFSGLCKLIRRGFMRFPLPDITRHTKIESCTLLVNPGASTQGEDSFVDIYVEQSDTGSAPTDEVELNSLSLGSSVAWTVPNFSPYRWYRSPELKSIVQPVIDRSGWVSNGHITIVCRCDGISRNGRSWMGADSEYRPKIELTVRV